VTLGGGERKASAARGLASSLRRLARTLAETLRSRAELFSLELQRERGRLLRLVLFAVGALVCLLFAAITGTIFIIAAFWESHRLLTIGLLTLGYITIAVLLVLAARKEAERAAHPFSSTIEQLRKDRDAFM